MTEPDPRAVTFLAQKGGQGKSTGAKNTAAELAARGHRVLLMDLDDNAHLTKDLGYWEDTYDKSPHIGHLVLSDKSAKPSNVILQTDWGFDFIPSNKAVKSLNTKIKEEEMQPSVALKNNLTDRLIGDFYDYIIIDTGPNQSILTNNAVIASLNLVIPLDKDDGVSPLRQTLNEIYKPLVGHVDVNILATYPNKIQNRIDHNRAERKLLEKINSPDCVQEYIPSYMEGTDPENIPDIASTVPNFARFTPEELEQINPSSPRLEWTNGQNPKPGMRTDSDVGESRPLVEVNSESRSRAFFQELADVVERGHVEPDDELRAAVMCP